MPNQPNYQLLPKRSIMMVITEREHMRALIIDPPTRTKIKQLKLSALHNIIDAAQAMQMDPEVLRDNNSAQTIGIHQGYRVTYTIERQPFGVAAHISISVSSRKKGPHPTAVDTILEAFGMLPLNQSVSAWVESLNPTHGHIATFAINVIQRLSDVRDVTG